MDTKQIFVFSNPEFCSYMAAHDWTVSVPDNAAAISICGTPDVQDYYGNYFSITDRHWFAKPMDNVLNISFDDIDEDSIPLDVIGKAYGITREQAVKIVDFIDAHSGCEMFFIHCHAGKSRSQAVARYIEEFIPGPWERHYDQLPTYNKRVYAYLRDVHHPIV